MKPPVKVDAGKKIGKTYGLVDEIIRTGDKKFFRDLGLLFDGQYQDGKKRGY